MANPQPDQYFKFSTELFRELVGFLMPAHVAKICLAVIGLTYGYHRKDAEITLQQFQQWTKVRDKGNLCRALRDAVQMKLIVRRDNGGKVTYRFQKDYDKWLPLSPRTKNPEALSHGTKIVVQRDKGAPLKPTPANVQPILKDNLNNKETIGLSDREAVEVYFKKLHNETWGKKYPMNFGRDRKILNTLLKTFSLDDLFVMVDRLLFLVQGGDKFYGEFSIPKLSQHQAKLLQDISKPLFPELPTWNDTQLAALDRVKGGHPSEEDRALVKKVYAKINAYEKWKERQ